VADAVACCVAVVCTKWSDIMHFEEDNGNVFTRGQALAVLLQRVHVGADGLA
jgi:hypothetical protein